ncbi:MAG TPA: methylated-DNA--[protein]-cysteine S-methyltransferase [Steroidobacteraceae bacterium]|nr:methylated-DNA--[protein]-cysteine S-methyltransferase [Steroidobacteraceae bacterium]
MKNRQAIASTADRLAGRMRDVCDYIVRNRTRRHTLKALAARASMSPFHFQRSFKRIVGVTPREFIDGERLKDLKSKLRGQATVTQAIYDSGFGSASRVYERVDSRLGMTPREYRAGGAGVEISHAAADSALGRMLIGATDRGICFLQFGASDAVLLEALAAEYPRATLRAMPASQRDAFDTWMQELARRIEGDAAGANLPLDVRGTSFQLKVWKTLLGIPRGAVASYAEIARAVGNPRATRAVANACAANRIAILIPCHRVIRGDGTLGGYRWGVARKRALLDRERAGETRTR